MKTQGIPSVLLGVMLLLLGLVLGAAIDPVVTTSASLSPVSSVTSDASSSVTKRYIGLNLQDYESNILNARFQIPDYVLPPRDGNIAGFGGGGSEHPNNGGLALEVQFSAQQIWQAMNAGYSHLRAASTWAGVLDPYIATRDQMSPFAASYWPRFAQGAGTVFPNEMRPEQLRLFDPAGWQFGSTATQNNALLTRMRVFTFPIAYQGVYDGSFAPGNYRVVFNQDGQYLGVVRIRQTHTPYKKLPFDPTDSGDKTDGYARMGWCGATDKSGNAKTENNGNGYYTYNGSPVTRSATAAYWKRPFSWRPADELSSIYAGISFVSGRFRKPDHLSQSALSSNETTDDGVYYLMPSNVSDSSANNTAERISVGLGCVSGAEYVNQTYQSFCSSQWPVNGDPRYVEYRITLTGTGQGGNVAKGWCQSILDNIKGECRHMSNLAAPASCDVTQKGIATPYRDWYKVGPISAQKDVIDWTSGIELTFLLQWPWVIKDSDHACMAAAIEKGSCLGRGVNPQFPVVCRQRDNFNSTLTEFDYLWTGPA